MVFSFDPFDFNGSQEVYYPVQEGRFEREDEQIKGKQAHFIGTTDWSDIEYLCSDYGFCEESSFDKGTLLYKDQGPFSEFSVVNDMQFDTFSATDYSPQEPVKLDAGLYFNLKSLAAEIPALVEPKKAANPISPASLELLKSYRTSTKRLRGEAPTEQINETSNPTTGGRELSTEDVMRVAAARFIQISGQREDNLSMLQHPFGCMLSNLTEEETKDVELGHILLSSAEKVGNRQYERASNLLTHCDYLCSNLGNPVQRVVYYFSVALRERIERETRRTTSKALEEQRISRYTKELALGSHPALLTLHQVLPIPQIIQFTAIQAIIDNVASSKRVHLIDLSIRTGIHWTILMQALAGRFLCPLELLTITAVGDSEDHLLQTGNRLISFAESLNLPFKFKLVTVSDMKDLKEDQFELAADEAPAVYCNANLWTMISRQERLENLIRVIKNLNPCVMAIGEVEANLNSTSFVTRFTEALFYFSAQFDCLDTYMDRNDHNRIFIEEILFSHGIRSIVADEGDERQIRHVGIDVWRSFFARFGMMELELSHLSFYQASLLAKQFVSGSSCNIDVNGKGMIVGWKGTPLHSISAWKFN